MNWEKMLLLASQMALVILVLAFTAAAKSPPQGLALPDCPDKCGDLIDIPYPFGIGPGCFRNPWYEIECQKTGKISTPILKKLSVAVLNISLPDSNSKLPGLINISQPIWYSGLNCPTNQNAAPLDLQASRGIFMYSPTANYLVAGGCDSLALMVTVDTPWIVAGCKSSCSRNVSLGYEHCKNGTGCCAITFPSEIAGYSVEFKTRDGQTIAPGDAECRFAFLADGLWWNQADLQSLPREVPVALDWVVTDLDFSSLPENPTLELVPHGTPGVGYLYCKDGYGGNPFLPQGCRDIDECKESPDLVCRGKCVNRPGSYSCIDIKTITYIVVGTVMGGIILLLLSWGMYKYFKRRREAKAKQKFFKRNGGFLLQQRLSSVANNHMEKGKLFTLIELDKATDHFNKNRILGRGGQGTVYKGMLLDGTIIAVKKSKVVDAEQIEHFVNEVVILSEINHRNVVKLLGFCLECEVPLLVYEFIPNGTLYQYLHDPERETPISWETRLKMANEVAEAVSYLHFAASIPIYHRDIKSSNILLDNKYRAKVADFGTSRSVTIDQTHLTTLVEGTFGYLDPEYYQTSQFTDKSDVYSFGVVLVELLTREKPISQLRAEEDINLATYFIVSVEENRLFDVLDKEVLEHGEKEDIIAVSNLAKRCLNLYGRYRPTMKEVAMELERIRSPRNTIVDKQNDAEMDRIRTEFFRGSDELPTLILSQGDVELTSWEQDQSFLSYLPR